MSEGIKYDSEKLQWSLIPFETLEIVVRVLMAGAKKYAPDNWKFVKPNERYFDACLRHLVAWQKGERLDPETNEPHLAHAICCLIFLLWKETHDTR